ncbi:MAG: hypothetical protein KDC95_09670 [Planctomycetes bacterium]|nr:hypothetical protein [Planctomycetota bacterium]
MKTYAMNPMQAWKRTLAATLVVLTTAFVVACEDQSSAKTKLDEAGQKISNKAEDLRDYAVDKKNEFVAASREKLDRLQDRWQSASEDVKAELREKKAAIEKDLDDLGDATAESFRTAKSKVADALDWMEAKLRN